MSPLSKQPTVDFLTAYKAMFIFLEHYYEQTGSSEIGGLLGGLSLLEDGMTADPGVWEEWKECMKLAMDDGVDARLYLRDE